MCTGISVSLLFLRWSGADRDLHSFPTRRSSDLKANSRGAFLSPTDARFAGRGFEGGYTIQYVRSEEHTSELQSLRHLVCRLLLEKKKREREGDMPAGTRLRAPRQRLDQ